MKGTFSTWQSPCVCTVEIYEKISYEFFKNKNIQWKNTNRETKGMLKTIELIDFIIKML